jgi:hypothetical protein
LKKSWLTKLSAREALRQSVTQKRDVEKMAFYAKSSATKRRRLNPGYGRRTHRVFRRSSRFPFRTKKTWGKPYKRRYYRKRVATRYPTPAAIPSPFKVQKEMLSSNLWSGPVASGTFDRSSAPTTDGNSVAAFFLSPIRSTEIFGDRKVEGDKARLVAANVQYTFANKMAVNITVRMTVVELKNELGVLAGTTINFTTATYLDRLFKFEDAGRRMIDFRTFLNATGKERDFYAMNTAEYKVLGQKIVKLGAHGSNSSDWTARPSVQGVHMYVPMNRLLDKNDGMTSQEIYDRVGYLSSPVTNDHSRYGYYKPILVLVEVIPEVGRYLTSEQELVEFERDVKYTFRDAA